MLRITTVACLIAMLAGGFGVVAQEPRPKHGQARPDAPPFFPRPGGPPRGHGPDPSLAPEPSFGFLSSEMRFGDKIVKGAPYSAHVVTESTQVLHDGTRITRKMTASIYRDAEGRVRREQPLGAIGPLTPSSDAPLMIFINDPVSSVHYVLDPRTRTARKMALSSRRPPPPPPPPQSSEEKVESLGKQTIEGVEAEGTRSTITIPAGEIGNDRPIRIVSERWDSTALQTVILSRHSDPRMGENVYRLTEIRRNEPASSLFEVPAGFAIEEETFAPEHRMKDMRRPRED